ncbi:hypothetical protein HYPSUDRAFT_204954 [Hypholoma sublateritium FD-334 SS-4]|uniref:Uncharacterized protein n=1 Tax=Hypholoma sublateritium (strain FD-334 SS-4) TaxID=945553 RepID=A0A0D2NJG7_HYPSF|nr:hypothetical protein HYPSUDRAFT_204954 [Hypholoma sublateritium FD-334 SS-4]
MYPSFSIVLRSIPSGPCAPSLVLLGVGRALRHRRYLLAGLARLYLVRSHVSSRTHPGGMLPDSSAVTQTADVAMRHMPPGRASIPLRAHTHARCDAILHIRRRPCAAVCAFASRSLLAPTLQCAVHPVTARSASTSRSCSSKLRTMWRWRVLSLARPRPVCAQNVGRSGDSASPHPCSSTLHAPCGTALRCPRVEALAVSPLAIPVSISRGAFSAAVAAQHVPGRYFA